MTLISSKEEFMIEGYDGYKLLCQIDKIFVEMTNKELRPETIENIDCSKK